MQYIRKIIDAEYERLILWIPVLIGIGISVYFGLDDEPHLLVGLNITAVGGLGWWACRKSYLYLIFAGIFFVGLGFFAGQIRIRILDAPSISKNIDKAEIIGVVEAVEYFENKSRIILKDVSIEYPHPQPLSQRERGVNSEFGSSEVGVEDPHPQPLSQKERGVIPKKIQITVWKNPPPVSAKIRAKGRLFPISTPNTVDGFNYKRHMFFKQIGATGFAFYTPKILELNQSINLMEIVRSKVRKNINKAINPPHNAIATALITGEKQSISKDTLNTIRDAGIAHILAISGMHIGLISGVIFFFTRLLLALVPAIALHCNIKKIAAVAALLGAFFYLGIAGFPISAQRAFIIVAFVITGILIDRKASAMRFVCWAATMILLFTPESLLSVSFQLSFAATIALIATFETFPIPYSNRNIFRYIFTSILVSIIAITATTPFSSFYFNRVAAYGVLGNMLILPILSFFVMPLAVFGLLLMPFGLSQFPFKLMEYGLAAMTQIADTIAHLPHSTYFIPSMELWGLVVLSIGGLWLCIWQSKIRLVGVLIIAIGLSSYYFKTTPDIIISKGIIAINTPETLAFIKTPRSKYMIEDMLKITGHTEHTKWDNTTSLPFRIEKQEDGLHIYYKNEEKIIKNLYKPKSIYINKNIKIKTMSDKRPWN